MGASINYKATILADTPNAYYRLDEASGTTLTDSSGHTRTGTYPGAGVTYSQAGAIRGFANNAVLLNGTSGYAATPINFSSITAQSVECWVKPSNLTFATFPRFFADDSSGVSFYIGSNANGAGLFFHVGNGTSTSSVTSTFQLSTSVYSHICGTWDGTTMTLYVNGVSQGTNTLSGAFGTTANTVDIGRTHSYGGDYWPGDIDEVAFYTYALTSTQVANHYAAGVEIPKTLGARVRMAITVTKTLGARVRLRSIKTVSLGSRTLLSVVKTVSLGARTRLGILVSKTLGARTRLRVVTTKTLGARTRLITSITKSLGARTLLRVLGTKTLGVRLVLHSFATKTLGARTRLSVLVTKSAGVRTLLRVLNTKTLGARLILHSFGSRTLGTRTLLRVVKTVVVGVRLHLFTSLTKSVGVRVRLAGIASGKFGVWANGTGTATYQYFRATQFPDPSLSLAPVMPRLGTSLVQWDATTTTLATLGMDVSTDGVNWQDVSTGLAMKFDGSTGYVSLPTTSLPTGASPWSLEAWCEFSAMPGSGYHTLLGFGTYSAQEMAVISVQSTGTTAQFVCSTYSGDISGPFTLQTNTVYHAVGTFDGTSTRLYINGALIAGPAPFTLNVTLAFANIGAGNSPAQDFFPGTLDEPAIYASCLSAQQVLNHYNAGIATPTSGAYATIVLADSPIRYYHLDDTNTTAIDSGSQAQNGTLHGTITQRVAGLITSRNGLQFPQYYTQPDPVADGFTSNTSTNYTSTSRTGGAALTPTWDTTNSRLILTGGTNGILTYTAISRADVDFLVDMSQSDTGGVVWRFNDASDYYWLDINDTQASSGTPNTATLYRVASNVQTQLATATLSVTVGAESRLFWRSTYRRFRITMLGSAITVSMDGQQVISYTDASPITGAGNIGLYSNGGSVDNIFYQLWIQPQGDLVTGNPSGDIVSGQFVYTRQRLATTDPVTTPEVIDLTTLAAGPNIRPGVQLASTAYNSAYIGKTMDDLAKVSNYNDSIGCDSSGNFTLNFGPGIANPAPWILQSTPNGIPSDLEHDSTLIVETADNTLFRNRQTLINVIGNGAFSDPFIGDGKATSFTLRYKIAAGYVPTIVLDNIPQTVGLKGTTGSQWYYAPGDAVIAQDSTATAIVLQSTDSLVIAYQGTFTTSVTVNNTASQQALKIVQGGSGIVEDVEDVSSLGLNTAAALTYAQALLTRYCIPGGRTVVYKTYRNGIDVGMIQPAFVPEFNMNDVQLLVTEVDWYINTTKINGSTVALYSYVVTCSELPYIASFSKLIASNLLTNTTGTIP